VLTLSNNIHESRLDGELQKLPADLRRLCELGLDGVEIGIHGLDAIRSGRVDVRRTAEFTSILQDFPLRLSLHSPDPLDLMSDREPELHIDVLRACLEFSEAVGAEVLVLHPGRWVSETEFPHREPWRPDASLAEEMMEREAATIRGLALRFSDVTLALENARPFLPHSPYTYAEFPWELAKQVRRIGLPNVGICLDTGHLHMASRLHGFSEMESVQTLAPDLAHLHVHDNFGRTGWWTEKTQTHQVPFGRGDLHMPVGMGDIDFGSLLAPILPTFERLVVCELRGRYSGRLPEHIDGFRRMVTNLSHKEPV
jgi:sugar phosphate isomerase/epimerase